MPLEVCVRELRRRAGRDLLTVVGRHGMGRRAAVPLSVGRRLTIQSFLLDLCCTVWTNDALNLRRVACFR